MKSLVGTVAIGRAGLGYFPSIQIHKAKGKQRRNLIQEEVRANVEEKRRSKMVGLCRQGAWTRWENFVKRKISWTDIWHADASRLKFLVQSVYDVLPSPANLFTWGKSGIPSCPLCARKGTLRHIMSACPRALGDGRYRWRHDQVLRTVAIRWTLQSVRTFTSLKRGRFTPSKPVNAPARRVKSTLAYYLPLKTGSGG